MKTFIWDLDGTLVDSYPIILKDLMNFFSKYGDYQIDDIHHLITEYSTKELFEREAERLQIDIQKLKKEYDSEKGKDGPEVYALIEGAKESILTLNSMGHQNIIYTHRDDFTKDIIAHHELTNEFVEIVTSNNGFKRKPDPDAIEYLIKKYQLDLNSTYYVGDRLLDVTSGNAANVLTVFFGPTGEVIKEADFNITKLVEIVNIK